MPFDLEDARYRLADLVGTDPGRLRDHIRKLARPRMTGTDEAVSVEADVRRSFEELGYRTREIPFEFSTWPGRFGLVVAGAATALAGGVGAILLLGGRPGAALVLALAGVATTLAPLLTLEWALSRLPWGRTTSRNLLFSHAAARPAWIVMAHRDSKSQLVPTLLRTAAITWGGIAWVVLVVLVILRFGGEAMTFPGLTITSGVSLIAAGGILALSWAANASPGALDNASGLAALLDVAAASRENGDVAFLVTDAEELGLVGARRAVPLLPPVQGVINVDSLDDHGSFFVAEGHGWRQRGSAPQLAAALLTAAAALDYPIRRRPLPRTIPVDHVPIARAGIPALTLLRGGWHSLLRVHRPSDDPHRLTGVGAAKGATLLSGALRLLRDHEAAHLAARRSAPS